MPILTDKQFLRARVCFYHQGTHGVESGWVHKITNDWIWIITAQNIPVESEEKVLVHIFGSNYDARFLASCYEYSPTTAKVNASEAQMVLFRIASKPSFQAMERNARRKTDDVFATFLAAGGDEEGVTIMDVSYSGIAFLATKEHPQHTKGVLALETKLGKTDVQVHVQNCTQIGSGKETQFRIGATVETQDRLGDVFWRKFVDDPTPVVGEEAA
jgi:hypothetical protein